jgi:hypothetical protein
MIKSLSAAAAGTALNGKSATTIAKTASAAHLFPFTLPSFRGRAQLEATWVVG